MNEILKEFKIVFGLDNKELESGIKQSENSLKNFGKVFGGIVASYFSYEIFKNVINGFVNFNNELRYNTELLGANAEYVGALGGALTRFGGDTNSAVGALNSLSSALEEAKFGGGALIEVSKRYGVAFSPFASAEDTLKSLAKQMGNYSKQQRKAIAESLGFDRSLTLAFADGGKELEKLIDKQKSLGIATKEDLEISKNFNNSFLDLKDIFNALMRDFSRVVLPAFTKLIELFTGFVEFLRKHKTLVVGFFVALLVALSPILLAFAKMAIASAAAFAPIYAVIAVVTAIALVLEDIYFYFKGWDSVTGKLVEKFPVLAPLLEVIRPIVMGIFETFEKIIEFIKNPSWESFTNIFKTIGKYLVEFINKPLDLIINAVESLQSKFPVLAPLLEPLKAIVMGIFETFEKIIEFIKNPSWESFVNIFKTIGHYLVEFINKPLDLIINAVESLQSKFPVLAPLLEPLKAIVEAIQDAFNYLVEMVSNLSFENVIKGFSDLKESILGGISGFLDSINPFSSGETKEIINNNKEIVTPALQQTPQIPSNNNTLNNSNTYNINNNINQNISSATPKALADSTNKIMIDSVNAMRQQRGAL